MTLNEGQYQLEELYEKFFHDVYQYLLYFTNNSSEAEDLTQDTFMRVFKSYQSFKNRSSMKTWIISIAKRTAIDHYRKKKLISLLPDVLLNIRKSEDGLPEEEMEKNEEWEMVQAALSKLKPDYRNVVILRGLREYSVKETAEILDWKPSKVKVDYHRALNLLKKSLGNSSEKAVQVYERKIQ
ncbi:RNA polymerase sigma factor [Rossellomorea vietnamensis]|uniref:RNA polymerase sigma factor n=1 Tax=Rossellomorea vietnamensis TaxID=218284 RepID=UPI00308F0490|nr:RNA polymerase sigma factor [Rossellomorea vietnamensis]